MRALRAFGWVGLAVLAVLAVAGVAVSAAALFAATPFGRRVVASALIRVVDAQVAGSFELGGVGVLPSGGIELRDLRVLDPEGHLVLAISRARLLLDVTALESRTIGVSLEVEGPAVMLEDERGGVSLARAFAPSHPSPPAPESPARGGGGFPWTVHVSKLAIRNGAIWWVDANGETRLEASDVDVDGRGTWGPDRARAELRLRARGEAPLDTPIAVDVVASRSGVAVHLPVLRAEVGGTALAAVGEGDLAQRTFRVAVSRLAVDRSEVREVEPRAPGGADVSATAYAESDGRAVTAAVHVEPQAPEGRPGGRADLAVATPLAAIGKALGFDVAVDRVDPSRVVAQAPAGEVTLGAHGGVSGLSAGRLADLRGRVQLSLSRSRLRGGEITRAEIAARADRGTLQIDRLSAAAPGGTVDGSGSWRERGAVSGSFGAQVRDVAVLARNVAALLGQARPPAVGGRASVRATLGGTSAAPSLSASIDAPSLRVGGLVASGTNLAVEASGRLDAMEGRAEGRIASLGGGGGAIARAVSLQASLAGEEVSLSAKASVPGAGKEPYAIDARGRFGPRRESLALSELAIAWPGTRFALVRPADVRLRDGPSVDRLELAAGAQRLVLSGGVGRRGALDARAEVARLNLAHLPPGLFPAQDQVAGELGLDVRATGTTAHPLVDARISLANGAFRSLAGLDAVGGARWDGKVRRAEASLSLARRDGGTVDVTADLPVPLGARAAQPIAVRVKAGGVPVRDVLTAIGGDARPAGTLSIDAVLEGRAGRPALRAQATLDDAAFEDLDGLSLWVSIEDGGDRLRVGASASQQGRNVLALDAGAPFDLAELLARPGDAVRALRHAPLEANVTVTGLDVALVAGRAGVPDGISGLVDGNASLSGSLAAPRGRAALEVSRGAWSGYRAVAGRVEATLAGGEVATAGRISVSGEEALRFTASLGGSFERLTSRDVLRRAPLRAEAIVQSLALARAAPAAEVPLSGDIRGRLTASGTPGAPEIALDLSGGAIAVAGRPLGGASLRARYSGGRGTAQIQLHPTAGGELDATLALRAAIGLGAGGVPLRDAPAEASVVADALDLGFLPAALPTLVRTASGKVWIDVHASGPLSRLSPRGKLHMENGTVAVAQLGEWTGIAVEASATADAVELTKLEMHRGPGRLSAQGSLRGLRSDRAALEAHVTSEAFKVTRAGQELATIDLRLDATGAYAARKLTVDARIPRGVVRLPNRTPRTLQSVDQRSDIVVGSRPSPSGKGAPGGGAAARGGAPAESGEPPFTLEAHVVVPNQLFIRGENPKIEVELKADIHYQREGSEDYADGTVEVVRGSVDPIAGRTFKIQRGKVQFTGGPPTAALLDVEATYDNPTAKVTVTVAGPLAKPDIHLSSQPPLDDAQIAMLIATGQAQSKAVGGSAGVSGTAGGSTGGGSGEGAGLGAVSGEEAGKAALSVLATQTFKGIAGKLPLDTVSVDPSAVRAGKYVTDQIYFAYTRRFDADPTKNENDSEVRVEYQISPHWTFESRYGNAQTGDASLIWSRNY